MPDPGLTALGQIVGLIKDKMTMEKMAQDAEIGPYQKLMGNEKAKNTIEKMVGFMQMRKKLGEIYQKKKTGGAGTNTGPWAGDYWRRLGSFDQKRNEHKPEGIISQLISLTQGKEANDKRLDLEQALEMVKNGVTKMGLGTQMTEQEMARIMGYTPSMNLDDEDFLNFTKRSAEQYIPDELLTYQNSLETIANSMGIKDPIILKQALEEAKKRANYGKNYFNQ